MNRKIADDRLLGVKAIAEEMGETERQVRYGINTGRIAAVKEGGLSVRSRVRYCANSTGPEYEAPQSDGAAGVYSRGMVESAGRNSTFVMSRDTED